MSKHWNPRTVQGGRTSAHRKGRGSWRIEQEQYRRRPKWRLPTVSWGELRLAILAGTLLGLGYASIPFGLAESAPSGNSRVDNVSGVRVIDGDTFHYGGEKIRIAGIDTPETHPPRCQYEAELGARATRRLAQLLAVGPFELRPIDRDEDVYGRKLRNVYRNGQSIGDILVSEGLARPYGNGRRSWCG